MATAALAIAIVALTFTTIALCLIVYLLIERRS